MIEKLKILIGIQKDDQSYNELLTLLLFLAGEEIKSFCGIEEIPQELSSTQMEMALIKFNRRGSEGVSTESFGGAAYSYADSYGEHIKAALSRFRKARLY